MEDAAPAPLAPSAAASRPAFNGEQFDLLPGAVMEPDLVMVIGAFYSTKGREKDCGVVLLRDLLGALAKGDLIAIKLASHSLRGVAGTCGALLVAEAANDFPTKASRAGIDELWRLLSEAREAFREVAGGVDFEEDPY